jgi:hypothetical protein
MSIHSTANSKASGATSVPRNAFSVDEFCQRNGLSRRQLYLLWARDAGPRYFLNGTHRRISVAAEAAWIAEGEAKTAETAA